MIIRVFASGSSGNCLLVQDRETNILVDAGISARRISGALAAFDLSISDLTGVLVTHEHSDHVSGIKTLVRHSGLQVYMPHTVASRYCGAVPEAENSVRIVPVGTPFMLGTCEVLAFHTPHDTDESVGYRISGNGIFAIATDMGCVTDEILHGLLGADAALVEANHDENMLRYGPYPAQLKRRILSKHGHLSNADCAQLVHMLYESGTGEIALGHISKENNTPECALRTVLAANPGMENSLHCAPASGLLEMIIGV